MAKIKTIQRDVHAAGVQNQRKMSIWPFNHSEMSLLSTEITIQVITKKNSERNFRSVLKKEKLNL